MATGRRTVSLQRLLETEISGIADREVARLVAAWTEAWDVLRRDWEQLAAAVEAGEADALSAARVRTTLAATGDQVQALTEAAGFRLPDAARRAIDTTGRLLPDVAGSQTTVAVSFQHVPTAAVNRIVERSFAQGQWTASRLPDHVTTVARRQLLRATVGATDVHAAAHIVMQAGDRAWAGGLARAATMVRTEVLDAHRAAAEEWTQANRDVIDGWVWLADLSARTCPSCWAMHGTTHPVDEPGPADHPNGRCSRMPVVRRDLQAAGQTAVEDPEAVFRQLSRADQLRVMGPGRLQALDDGASFRLLAVERRNPGWRNSVVPRTVTDLRSA